MSNDLAENLFYLQLGMPLSTQLNLFFASPLVLSHQIFSRNIDAVIFQPITDRMIGIGTIFLSLDID
jgi:hypothetical protein